MSTSTSTAIPSLAAWRRAAVITLSLPLLLLAGAAHASDAPPPGRDGTPPAPPPEAVAACQGKQAGDQVSFTGRNGETLTGQCQLNGDTLAARPARGAAPGGQRPPAS